MVETNSHPEAHQGLFFITLEHPSYRVQYAGERHSPLQIDMDVNSKCIQAKHPAEQIVTPQGTCK